MIVNEDGSETYGVAPKPPSAPAVAAATVAVAPTPPPAAPKETEEDDLSAPVTDGAKCKRMGCKAVWEGEGVSRGSGEKAECTYHSQAVCLSSGGVLKGSRYFMKEVKGIYAARGGYWSLTSL